LKLTIRDMQDEILEKLDKLVIEKHYNSRNQLVVDILSRYAAVNDELYVQALNVVVRTMVREQLDKLSETSDSCLRSIEIAAKRLSKAAQKLDMYITDDFMYDGE
jgi:hypothetical protein